MVDSTREALAKARDWITIEERGPDGDAFQLFFGEQFVDEFGSFNAAADYADYWAKILAAYGQASRSAAIEECAAIANEWAQSKSCTSHENDPCCHVRTGAEIRDRIELLARLKGEG